MKLEEIELLEHILENRKAGRAAGYGLILNGEASSATSIFGMGLYEGYAIAPRTHEVNGFTVPAPEVEAPKDKTRYWVSDSTHKEWTDSWRWSGNDEYSALLLERNSVFLTKEAAVANAKAEKGIDPYSEGEK